MIKFFKKHRFKILAAVLLLLLVFLALAWAVVTKLENDKYDIYDRLYIKPEEYKGGYPRQF